MTHLKLWFSIWDGANDPLTEALDSELELVFNPLQRIQFLCLIKTSTTFLFPFFIKCKLGILKELRTRYLLLKRPESVNNAVGMQLRALRPLCCHRHSTKTLWRSALISPFVDNNNPLQHVTYPLTATCTAKHHTVNNFLIVLWLWNRTPDLEGRLKNHAALSCADWLVSFCRVFLVWRTKD